MSTLASANRALNPSELSNRQSPSFLPRPTRKISFPSTLARPSSSDTGSTRPKNTRKASFTNAFHTMTGSKFSRRRTDSSHNDAKDNDSEESHKKTPTRRSEKIRSRIPTPVATPNSPRGYAPLTRTSSYTSNLDSFISASNNSTLPIHGMQNTFPSSVSNMSLSSMNIYPKNEYVNIYDSRPQVPAGYESETRPLMPPSSKSYNEADMTPKASSGGFFRGLGKSNSSSQGNLRGLMQSGSRENIAPRSTVTPQRGLLQPIQPPLPRSQTLGNLLVCGSGNAGGRPSSELDHRNARERFYKSIGLKGSTSSVFSSKKGTHGSTSEQFEHSSSTDTLGNQETAQKYTRRNDLRGNLVYMPSMEVLAGSNEDKWVMVDGFEHREISKAMPTNFWLGRFVTLSDRFHHSDDEVILNNPSSSSGIQDQIPTYDFSHSNAHLLSDDDEEDNPAERRRVQRVFMTLTKVCSTEEARKSLHVFWKEYARKFGFPGPNSMMRMGGLSASTSVSSGLNIKAAAGDSQSVRSGLNVTAAASDARSVRSVLSERPSVRSGLNVSAAAGVGGGGASVRSGLSERPSVSSGLNVSAAAGVGVGVGLRQGKDAAAGIVGLGHGQPATPASVRLGETETAAFGGPGLGEEKPTAPRVGLGQGKEKESEAPAPTPAPTSIQVQMETQKQKGKEPLKEVKSCEGLSAGVGEGGKGSVRKGMFSRLRGLRRSLAGSDE